MGDQDSKTRNFIEDYKDMLNGPDAKMVLQYVFEKYADESFGNNWTQAEAVFIGPKGEELTPEEFGELTGDPKILKDLVTQAGLDVLHSSMESGLMQINKQLADFVEENKKPDYQEFQDIYNNGRIEVLKHLKKNQFLSSPWGFVVLGMWSALASSSISIIEVMHNCKTKGEGEIIQMPHGGEGFVLNRNAVTGMLLTKSFHSSLLSSIIHQYVIGEEGEDGLARMKDEEIKEITAVKFAQTLGRDIHGLHLNSISFSEFLEIADSRYQDMIIKNEYVPYQKSNESIPPHKILMSEVYGYMLQQTILMRITDEMNGKDI